jgi:hypothetical protein
MQGKYVLRGTGERVKVKMELDKVMPKTEGKPE